MIVSMSVIRETNHKLVLEFHKITGVWRIQYKQIKMKKKECTLRESEEISLIRLKVKKQVV